MATFLPAFLAFSAGPVLLLAIAHITFPPRGD